MLKGCGWQIQEYNCVPTVEFSPIFHYVPLRTYILKFHCEATQLTQAHLHTSFRVYFLW